MKVAIIGANGHIGSRIVNEALNRGHQVTGIARNPEKLKLEHPNLTFVKGDALNTAELAGILKGHDAVISSFGIDWTKPETFHLFSDVAKSVIDATKQAGAKTVDQCGRRGQPGSFAGRTIGGYTGFPGRVEIGCTGTARFAGSFP